MLTEKILMFIGITYDNPLVLLIQDLEKKIEEYPTNEYIKLSYYLILFDLLKTGVEKYVAADTDYYEVNLNKNPQDKVHYWRFVEQHYPGYHYSNDIGHSDFLQCLVDNEIESEEKEDALKNYNGTPADLQLQSEHYQLECEIIINAIGEFCS